MPRNNFELKIKTRGRKHPTLWIEEIDKRIYPEMQDRLLDLANEAVHNMRNIISESIKRVGATGRLENSIKYYPLSTTAGIHIGIGRVSELPPYWEVLNDGGYVPVSNRGFFNAPGQSIFGQGIPPMSGMGGEQWIHTGSRSDYLLTPRKAIQPVGYINISSAIFNTKIRISIDQFMKTLVK